MSTKERTMQELADARDGAVQYAKDLESRLATAEGQVVLLERALGESAIQVETFRDMIADQDEALRVATNGRILARAQALEDAARVEKLEKGHAWAMQYMEDMAKACDGHVNEALENAARVAEVWPHCSDAPDIAAAIRALITQDQPKGET